MNRRQMMTSFAGLATLAAADVPWIAASPAPEQAPPLSIFNPRQQGAAGDGKHMDSGAINAAIDACSRAGGGVVYLSPGIYLCGTVVLKSNVTLYLEAGATILGSSRIADYAPKHLIFARDAENVGLAGPGRIDGQGHAFWTEKKRAPVPENKIWSDAIHNNWGNIDRPSPMVEFENVTNLRIEDVRLEGAAGWTLRPFNCSRVTIHGICIRNPVYGPNTDGIDIVGSQDVLVSDCIVETGDDAICLKSKDVDGMPCRTTRNVTVTNCIVSGCCNGFKIGTESEGGFENITFSNSIIYNDDVDLPSRLIAGICLSVVDGGWADGIVISGIQMRRARAPIAIRLGDRSRKRDNPQKGMRGILIDGIHASDAILTSSITGLPGKELEDIRLANIDIATVYPGKKEWVKQPVPEADATYPASRMFGWLPASGLYCRHVRGLSLHNLRFSAPADEWRPTVICDSVRQLALRGFETTAIRQGVPPVSLVDVSHAWVSEAAAPAGSRALLSVTGSQAEEILVSGCDLRQAERAVEAGGTESTVRAEFNVAKK